MLPDQPGGMPVNNSSPRKSPLPLDIQDFHPPTSQNVDTSPTHSRMRQVVDEILLPLAHTGSGHESHLQRSNPTQSTKGSIIQQQQQQQRRSSNHSESTKGSIQQQQQQQQRRSSNPYYHETSNITTTVSPTTRRTEGTTVTSGYETTTQSSSSSSPYTRQQQQQQQPFIMLPSAPLETASPRGRNNNKQERRDSIPTHNRMQKVVDEIRLIAANRSLRENEQRQQRRDSIPTHSRMRKLADEISSIARKGAEEDSVIDELETIGQVDSNNTLDDKNNTFHVPRRSIHLRRIADEILTMVIDAGGGGGGNDAAYDEGSTVVDELLTMAGDFYDSDDNNEDYYDENSIGNVRQAHSRMKQVVDEILMIAEQQDAMTPEQLHRETQVRRNSIPSDSPMRQVVDEILLAAATESSASVDGSATRSHQQHNHHHHHALSPTTNTSPMQKAQRRDSIPTHNRMREIVVELLSIDDTQNDKTFPDDDSPKRRTSQQYPYTDDISIPLDIRMKSKQSEFHDSISTIADDETLRRKDIYEQSLGYLAKKQQYESNAGTNKYGYNISHITPPSSNEVPTRSSSKQEQSGGKNNAFSMISPPSPAKRSKSNIVKHGALLHSANDPPPPVIIPDSPKLTDVSPLKSTETASTTLQQHNENDADVDEEEEEAVVIALSPRRSPDSAQRAMVVSTTLPATELPELLRRESLPGRQTIPTTTSKKIEYPQTPRRSNVNTNINNQQQQQQIHQRGHDNETNSKEYIRRRPKTDRSSAPTKQRHQQQQRPRSGSILSVSSARSQTSSKTSGGSISSRRTESRNKNEPSYIANEERHLTSIPSGTSSENEQVNDDLLDNKSDTSESTKRSKPLHPASQSDAVTNTAPQRSDDDDEHVQLRITSNKKDSQPIVIVRSTSSKSVVRKTSTNAETDRKLQRNNDEVETDYEEEDVQPVQSDRSTKSRKSTPPRRTKSKSSRVQPNVKKTSAIRPSDSGEGIKSILKTQSNLTYPIEANNSEEQQGEESSPGDDPVPSTSNVVFPPRDKELTKSKKKFFWNVDDSVSNDDDADDSRSLLSKGRCRENLLWMCRCWSSEKNYRNFDDDHQFGNYDVDDERETVSLNAQKSPKVSTFDTSPVSNKKKRGKTKIRFKVFVPPGMKQNRSTEFTRSNSEPAMGRHPSSDLASAYSRNTTKTTSESLTAGSEQTKESNRNQQQSTQQSSTRENSRGRSPTSRKTHNRLKTRKPSVPTLDDIAQDSARPKLQRRRGSQGNSVSSFVHKTNYIDPISNPGAVGANIRHDRNSTLASDDNVMDDQAAIQELEETTQKVHDRFRIPPSIVNESQMPRGRRIRKQDPQAAALHRNFNNRLKLSTIIDDESNQREIVLTEKDIATYFSFEDDDIQPSPRVVARQGRPLRTGATTQQNLWDIDSPSGLYGVQNTNPSFEDGDDLSQRTTGSKKYTTARTFQRSNHSNTHRYLSRAIPSPRSVDRRVSTIADESSIAPTDIGWTFFDSADDDEYSKTSAYRKQQNLDTQTNTRTYTEGLAMILPI